MGFDSSLSSWIDNSNIDSNTEFIGKKLRDIDIKKDSLVGPTTKLVNIISYCINPNHFHLLLTPLIDRGIEKFMQRIGGYTRYFNEKYKRNGVLFQGRFKSKHISDDRYLLHLSVYINCNNLDSLGSPTTKLSKSSLGEYLNKTNESICDKEIVLGQYKNIQEYKKYTNLTWKDICKRKEDLDPK